MSSIGCCYNLTYTRFFFKHFSIFSVGVCNNDQYDETTDRKGEIIPHKVQADIEPFAESWLVRKESKRCFTPPEECVPRPVTECEIILSPVFEVSLVSLQCAAQHDNMI